MNTLKKSSEEIVREYSEKATSTAMYQESSKLMYPVLKLAGETSEFISKMLDEQQDRPAIIKEVGDIFWYVNAVSHDLDRTLHGIFEASAAYLGDYPNNSNAVDAINQALSVDYLCKEDHEAEAFRCLVTRPGEICELVGKRIRDANYDFTDEDFVSSVEFKMFELVSSVLFYLWMSGLFISVEEIMDANIEKLFSRKERGVLHGSGDNR